MFPFSVRPSYFCLHQKQLLFSSLKTFLTSNLTGERSTFLSFYNNSLYLLHSTDHRGWLFDLHTFQGQGYFNIHFHIQDRSDTNFGHQLSMCEWMDEWVNEEHTEGRVVLLSVAVMCPLPLVEIIETKKWLWEPSSRMQITFQGTKLIAFSVWAQDDVRGTMDEIPPFRGIWSR